MKSIEEVRKCAAEQSTASLCEAAAGRRLALRLNGCDKPASFRFSSPRVNGNMVL